MKAYKGKGFRVLFDVVRDTEGRWPCYPHGDTVRASDDAVRYFTGLQHLGLVPQDRESFCVLLLNARHKTIGFHVCSIGGLSSAPVHPREVFRPALAVAASALVLCHNHPSGDHTPSVEDRRITDRLTEAGELLGVNVLDHVVIGAGRYFAFADACSRDIPS